jgi:zinc protease
MHYWGKRKPNKDGDGTMRRKLIMFVVLLFLIPGISFGLDAKREVMDNGLIVLHTERNNLPIVKVSLLVKASPLDEPPEKAGLANLTAQMLSEGTRNRTSQQISEEIEFVGGSVGASADEDYIMVSLSVLKKDIENGFDIFSDILLTPTFPGKELNIQKELITGSLQQSEEDPGYVAEKTFAKAVFGEHPYGRQVEGTVESVRAIERDALVAFHAKYFRPNNSILSVAGDISFAELKALINKYLSHWSKGKIPDRKEFKINDISSPKVIRIDKDLTQANIIIGHIGIERSNPDYYAVSVMNYILGGGGFASRLMQIIRDKMGLAYDVHSYFRASKERGFFQAEVQTKNKSANTAISEILKQMKKIQDEDVSVEELSDAKSYLTGSFPRRLDTMAKLSQLLALVEFYDLGMNYDKDYIEHINEVGIDDVRRVANKYLHPDHYVLVIVADQEKVK